MEEQKRDEALTVESSTKGELKQNLISFNNGYPTIPHMNEIDTQMQDKRFLRRDRVQQLKPA